MPGSPDSLIILIDDSPDDALLITNELRRANVKARIHTISTAAELHAALDLSPLLVISDHVMPGFGGFEALRIVRERDATLPFIMVSGTSGEEVAVAAMRAGASDFVTKQRLGRLGPAVEREATESRVRRELLRARQQYEEVSGQIAFQARLLDCVQQAVIATDVNGSIIYWNRFAEQLYGWPAADVIGRSIIEITPSPAMRETAAAIMETLGRGASWTGEFDVSRKDGSTFSAFVTDSPIHDSEGKLIGVVGVSIDITEPKKVQQEVARHGAQQSAIASIGHIGLSRVSVDFLLDVAADVVAETLGADTCEIFRLIGGKAQLAASCGWPPHFSGAVLVDAGRGSLPSFLMNTDEAVVIADYATEQRFERSPLYAALELRSGVVAAIPRGADAWGFIAIHSMKPRDYSRGDAGFLTAVANVLGQAIERRRVEEELRVRAAQQAAVAELGKLAVSSFDETIVGRACELLREVLGVESAGFFCGDDGETAEVRHECTADGGSISAAVRGRSGTFGVLRIATKLTRSFTEADAGFVQSIATILADSMEREQAQQALTASEARYRAVVDGAGEIIYTTGSDGRIMSLNPAFESITGWSVDEMVGRSFLELMAADDATRSQQVFTRVLAGESLSSFDCDVTARDGRRVSLECSVFPRFENGRVTAVYGFARDVTDKRRAEQEQQRLRTQLEQAQRLTSLGRLAATIAHEFNNVLMGISPFVDLLRRDMQSTRATMALEQMTKSIRRGRGITDEILRFTQPAEPVLSSMPVRRWLDAVVLEARSVVGLRHAVDVECADVPPMLGDPNQLSQAVMNLILNARDAMRDGGRILVSAAPATDADVKHFGLANDGFVHCRVADTGAGITDELLQHIFEPLFTTKKNGTGLGLAVTHQVVTRHGGAIFAESSVGVGTTFHLFIPIAAPVAEHASAAPNAKIATVRARFQNVLLVEDEPAVSAGLSALLQADGIAVEVVATGAEVLDAIARTEPDVVVLDIGLPDMDGTKVYAGVADRYPTLPILFSTGHGDKTKLEPYLAKNNVGFLLKPYDADALLDALDQLQ